MTYTFEIIRILTEKQTCDCDEVIRHIKYNIHGISDTSPVETASYTDVLVLQDSSPQVLWDDSMSEEAAIAIVRTRYDNDENFRTLVNDSINSSIAANRPIVRVIHKESFPWNNNSPQ